MKSMPHDIEKKLREIAREDNLSEVEIIGIKELFINLANIEVKEKERRRQQLKQAA